jgi:hypothetical protein
MQVPLTEQGKLQSQTVLRSVFVLFGPALLAQLREDSMGRSFLELEFSSDIGHPHPPRLTCEQLDRLKRSVNCSLDNSHNLSNILPIGTVLQQ